MGKTFRHNGGHIKHDNFRAARRAKLRKRLGGNTTGKSNPVPTKTRQHHTEKHHARRKHY